MLRTTTLKMRPHVRRALGGVLAFLMLITAVAVAIPLLALPAVAADLQSFSTADSSDFLTLYGDTYDPGHFRAARHLADLVTANFSTSDVNDNFTFNNPSDRYMTISIGSLTTGTKTSVLKILSQLGLSAFVGMTGVTQGTIVDTSPRSVGGGSTGIIDFVRTEMGPTFGRGPEGEGQSGYYASSGPYEGTWSWSGSISGGASGTMNRPGAGDGWVEAPFSTIPYSRTLYSALMTEFTVMADFGGGSVSAALSGDLEATHKTYRTPAKSGSGSWGVLGLGGNANGSAWFKYHILDTIKFVEKDLTSTSKVFNALNGVYGDQYYGIDAGVIDLATTFTVTELEAMKTTGWAAKRATAEADMQGGTNGVTSGEAPDVFDRFITYKPEWIDTVNIAIEVRKHLDDHHMGYPDPGEWLEERTVTVPTCTDKGTYDVYCNFGLCITYGIDCIAENVQTIGTDPLNHGSHGTKDGPITTPPSCIAAGVRNLLCVGCDAVRGTAAVAIDPLAHNPGPAATCLDPQECTLCHVELAPKSGHTSNGATVDCQTPELCSVCFTVMTPASGHNYTGPAATCMDPQICANAGCTEALAPVDDDNHVDQATGVPYGTDDDVKLAATCALTGLKDVYCSECDTLIDEDLEVGLDGTNHVDQATDDPYDTYDDLKLAATCCDTGLKDVYCEGCDGLLDEDVEVGLNAANHIDQATGQPYGTAQGPISTPPSCEVPGVRAILCEGCGHLHGTASVSPLGHSYSSWVTTVPPTLETPGEEKRICTRPGCDWSETRAINIGTGCGTSLWAVIGQWLLFAFSPIINLFTPKG